MLWQSPFYLPPHYVIAPPHYVIAPPHYVIAKHEVLWQSPFLFTTPLCHCETRSVVAISFFIYHPIMSLRNTKYCGNLQFYLPSADSHATCVAQNDFLSVIKTFLSLRNTKCCGNLGFLNKNNHRFTLHSPLFTLNTPPHSSL